MNKDPNQLTTQQSKKAKQKAKQPASSQDVPAAVNTDERNVVEENDQKKKTKRSKKKKKGSQESSGDSQQQQKLGSFDELQSSTLVEEKLDQTLTDSDVTPVKDTTSLYAKGNLEKTAEQLNLKIIQSPDLQQEGQIKEQGTAPRILPNPANSTAKTDKPYKYYPVILNKERQESTGFIVDDDQLRISKKSKIASKPSKTEELNESKTKQKAAFGPMIQKPKMERQNRMIINQMVKAQSKEICDRIESNLNEVAIRSFDAEMQHQIEYGRLEAANDDASNKIGEEVQRRQEAERLRDQALKRLDENDKQNRFLTEMCKELQKKFEMVSQQIAFISVNDPRPISSFTYARQDGYNEFVVRRDDRNEWSKLLKEAQEHNGTGDGDENFDDPDQDDNPEEMQEDPKANDAMETMD